MNEGEDDETPPDSRKSEPGQLDILTEIIRGNPSEKTRKKAREGIELVVFTFAVGGCISLVSALGETWSVGPIQAFKIFGWWWLWIPLIVGCFFPFFWLLGLALELVFFGIAIPFMFVPERAKQILAKVSAFLFTAAGCIFVVWLVFGIGQQQAQKAVSRAAVQVAKAAAESQRKTTEAIQQNLASKQPNVAELKVQLDELANDQKALQAKLEAVPKAGGFMDKFFWPMLVAIAVLLVKPLVEWKRPEPPTPPA